MDEVFHTCTLPCGMRLLHLPSPTDVAYCGMAIDAGTRDEPPGQWGLAHFVEHGLFKGTRRHRAWHILNRMEAVGGDLNAYTSKEETMVHAAFMREHLPRAVELVMDVVFNSTFPQAEMDREREVIVEEIDSYRDNPAELIYDEFENILFAGHPLGHDILGQAADVRTYGTEHALDFTRRLYRPERMVFFVMGNYAPEYVRRVVERAAPAATAPPPEGEGTARAAAPVGRSETGGTVVARDMHTHQAHVMLGCRAYGSNDERRIALYFLNNILGGPGMNSRLNLALRERRGLVYTVESTLANYTDTAAFSIYFGCDAGDVDRCLRLVHRELKALMEQPLSPRQFGAALRQVRGQIGVCCDNFETYVLDIAKSFLHYKKAEGASSMLAHLGNLTPELLQQVARELFPPENLTTLVYR